MADFPVWVWAVGVAGTIGAGIGLGYLIIFLFWKLEKYFNPPAPAPVVVEPEEPAEEPEETPEPEEEVMAEAVEEVTEEELVPVMLASMSDEEKKFVKFTMVLHARFKHPFAGIRTIACWDIGLEAGDEVRDTEGNVLTFRVVTSPGEEQGSRCFLVDEAGPTTIEVISGKQYIRRETNLDVDKIRLPR